MQGHVGREEEDGVVTDTVKTEESVLHVYFDGVREGTVGVGKTNVQGLVV